MLQFPNVEQTWLSFGSIDEKGGQEQGMMNVALSKTFKNFRGCSAVKVFPWLPLSLRSFYTESQLFSGSLFPFFFFGGCPATMVQAQKRVPFFFPGSLNN